MLRTPTLSAPTLLFRFPTVCGDTAVSSIREHRPIQSSDKTPVYTEGAAVSVHTAEHQRGNIKRYEMRSSTTAPTAQGFFFFKRTTYILACTPYIFLCEAHEDSQRIPNQKLRHVCTAGHTGYAANTTRILVFVLVLYICTYLVQGFSWAGSGGPAHQLFCLCDWPRPGSSIFQRIGRGPAQPIAFSKNHGPARPSRCCSCSHINSSLQNNAVRGRSTGSNNSGCSNGSTRPGPAHDIGGEAHETRALYGLARQFCGQARGFDGPGHGALHVLSRTQR